MHDELRFEWYDIERDPAGWDACVNNCAQNLFHRSATLAAEQHGRAVRRGIVVKQAQTCVCLIGGLVLPLGTGGLFRALSFPPAGGLTMRDLPSRVLNWLYMEGFTAVRIGCRDGGVEDYRLEPRIARARDWIEFVCALWHDRAQRLQKINPEHLRLYEVSQQQSVFLQRVDRRQAFQMAACRVRWAGPSGVRLHLGAVLRDYLRFRRVATKMQHDGSGNLYALRDAKGCMLTIAYMLEGEETAYYLTGASSEEGRRRGAEVRMFVELADRYARKGMRWLNMGGVSAQAATGGHPEFATYRFKRGFGGEPVLRRALMAGVVVA